MTKAIDLTISSDEEPSPNSRSLKDYVKSKECLLREKKHSPLVHLASFYDDLEWSLESDTFDFLKGTFFSNWSFVAYYNSTSLYPSRCTTKYWIRSKGQRRLWSIYGNLFGTWTGRNGGNCLWQFKMDSPTTTG